MFKKIVSLVILVPLAVILIAFAVANRQFVAFSLNPFNPSDTALSIELPLFVYFFVAFFLGLLVGGIVTWARQGRYRRAARRSAGELRDARVQQAASRPPTSGGGLPATVR